MWNRLFQIAHSIKSLLYSERIVLTYQVKQVSDFCTNPSEFRSILSNLVSNAIKYSDLHKSKRNITINFSSDSITGVLIVRDNGIGIKDENISKIMKRNFQVTTSTSGIGLGLHMVATSLNNIGGSIKITSEFGEGSEFRIEIPNERSKAN